LEQAIGFAVVNAKATWANPTDELDYRLDMSGDWCA
jgi:hypothetical protein